MNIKYIGNYIEGASKNLRGIGNTQFDLDSLKENESIFKFLNAKDKDILYLIFISKKKQKSVQKIINRSQPSLVYDIKRIRERIEFVFYIKRVFDIFIDFIQNKGNQYDKEMVEIMVLMFYTTSFTLTSKTLKIPQIYVRYTFEKILKKIKDLKHWEAYEIFSTISQNKNKIKRLYNK